MSPPICRLARAMTWFSVTWAISWPRTAARESTVSATLKIPVKTPICPPTMANALMASSSNTTTSQFISE